MSIATRDRAGLMGPDHVARLLNAPESATSMASASVFDVGSVEADYIVVTGGTTITNFGSAPDRRVMLIFTDPITVAAGALDLAVSLTFGFTDRMTIASDGAGYWRVVGGIRQGGSQLMFREAQTFRQNWTHSGTVSWSLSRLFWSGRLIQIGDTRQAPSVAGSLYTEFTCPVSGTIEVVGGGTVACDAGGIVWDYPWQQLFYDTSVTQGGNAAFKIVRYDQGPAGFRVPDHWLPVASHNADGFPFTTVFHPLKISLKPGDSWDTGRGSGVPGQIVTVESVSLTKAHHAKHLVVTGSDPTLTLASAATLGDGWWCSFEVPDNQIVTIAPQPGQYLDSILNGTRKLFQRQSGRIIADGGGAVRIVGVADFVKIVDIDASNVAQLLLTLPKGFRRFRLNMERVRPTTDGAAMLATASLDGGATFKAGANDYAFFTAGVASGSTSAMQMMGANLTNGYAYQAMTGHAEIFPGDGTAKLSVLGESFSIYQNNYSRQSHGTGFAHSDPTTLGRATHLRLFMSAGNFDYARGSLWGVA